MKLVRSVICGDECLEISADTKARIGYANARECENFEKSHWKWPSDLPVKTDMWKSFCNMLNNVGGFFSDRNEIGKKCLRALGNESKQDELSDCKFCFIKDEDFDFGYIIEMNLSYVYYIEHPFTYEKQPHIRNEVIKCTYPQDFYTIWMVFGEYYRGKIKKGKLRKVQSGYEFIKTNKEDILSFKTYVEARERIRKREDYQHFLQSKQRVLRVDDHIFFKDYCGFDIKEKLSEIKSIISKITNSNDPGEEKVAYAIKWCLAEVDKHIEVIEKNCESKYRYKCIILKKEDFIDEPQEYDHILVSSEGIILIETKHWKGKIKINPDGKWLRDPNNNGQMMGVESPAFQMRRHELLIKNILPNVPVISLLCFSNVSAVLEGEKIFKDYPIIYVDQLREKLIKILLSGNSSEDCVDYIVEQIEKYKINKM